MKLHCPHCGVKGSTEDSYLGRKVKCPKCHGIFEVLPDVAAESSTEASFSAAPSSLPVDVQSALPEVDIPAAVDVDLTEQETETEADTLLAEEEAEVPYERSGDVTAPEPLTTSAAEQEETLDWEDIASEIDLQLTEATMGEEQEGPAALSSFEEELEKSVDDFDLMEELSPHDDADNPAVVRDKDQEEISLAESSEKDMLDDGVELEPYGIDKQQCWQCGKEENVGESFTAKDGRLYCLTCAPVNDTERESETVQEQMKEETFSPEKMNIGTMGPMNDVGSGFSGAFSLGEVIGEAWAKTKGAKGTIWAGTAVMYGVILVIVGGGTLLLPPLGGGQANATGMVGNVLFQVVIDVLSVLFTAGLLFMGMRQAANKSISWQMIFNGFSVAVQIILAAILQFILVSLGFLFLVLPGIYLVVGYALTIPLIIDKGLSPWQAMETSRKVIHKIWWKMAGLFVVVGLILLVSLLALGIGLIWTWPMFIVLAGVVYRHLIGDLEKAA